VSGHGRVFNPKPEAALCLPWYPTVVGSTIRKEAQVHSALDGYDEERGKVLQVLFSNNNPLSGFVSRNEKNEPRPGGAHTPSTGFNFSSIQSHGQQQQPTTCPEASLQSFFGMTFLNTRILG